MGAAVPAFVALAAAAAVPAALPEAHAQTTNPFGLTDVGSYTRPALADLDDDGDLDLLSGELNDFYYFQNTGSSTSPAFAAPVANPFGLVGVNGRITPAVADLDGDGDLDVLMGEYEGGFFYFENIGAAATPNFTTRVSNPYGLQFINAYSAPAFADLDGDGDLDLFAGSGSGNFFYFQNTGTANAPAFAAPTTNPFGLVSTFGGYSSPAFADVDGDGDLDLLSGKQNGSFAYYENTGTAVAPSFGGSFENPFGLSDAGEYSAPVIGNLDGVGDADVLAGYSDGNFVRFADVVLPVELASFTATTDEDAVLLRWQTASETNNAGFEVHQMLPGDTGAFTLLGFVEGHGTTTEARAYAFRTKGLAPGTYRFRLKQLDFDGASEYSDLVEVEVGVPGTFALSPVYPNPFNPKARFELAVAAAQEVHVAVYDVLGRQMASLFRGTMEANARHPFEVDGGAWPSGTYVIVAEGETFRTRRTVTLLK